MITQETVVKNFEDMGSKWHSVLTRYLTNNKELAESLLDTFIKGGLDVEMEEDYIYDDIDYKYAVSVMVNNEWEFVA